MEEAGTDHTQRRDGVWSASFQGLLWTNFFTAVNDNVFRWFVIGTGKEFVSETAHPQILMWGTIFFVLPYLLFAVPAGWLADRYSKRDVILVCKFAEIAVMLMGVLALLLQSLPFLFFVVFLMGAQSALFSPAKVGKIPELLGEEEISQGNGWFNLTTLSAVVIGMGVGNWLADVTGYRGQDNLWITLLVLVGIAVVGTAVGFLMRRVPAANPRLRFPVNLLAETGRQFVPLFQHSRLWRVAWGVAFFWTFASLAQINVDAFADENGLLLEREKIPILISLVLGVGAGSVFAGLASRGRIELGLVPVGAIGMILFSVAICFLTPEGMFLPPGTWWGLPLTCLLFALLGISAGFFDVPLSSWLQFNSPATTRGSILAATNFLLFACIVVTSGLYGSWLRAPVAGKGPVEYPAAWRTGVLSAEELEGLDGRIASFRHSDADKADAMVNAAPPELRIALVNRLVEQQVEMQETAGQTARLPSDAAKGQEAAANGRPAGSGSSAGELFSDPALRRQERSIRRALADRPLVSSRAIFLWLAIATVPVLFYTLYRLLKPFLRVILWWLINLLYRVRVHGQENLPDHGPAVMIANHYTWLDAMLLMLVARRDVKSVAWAGNFKSRFARWFAGFADVQLITGGPKSIAQGIRDTRAWLQEGKMVLVFPEGGLSRTGQIQAFKPGVLRIAEGTEAKIIPVYLDQLWGSVFSYQGGKAFGKWPRTFRRPVSIHIGPALPEGMDLFAMRQKLQKMGSDAVPQRIGRFDSPVRMFLVQCKRRLFRTKVGDSTGQVLTGGSLLMRTLILRRLLRKHVLKADETHVGVLIPPSTGGVVVNMALALDRRVACNLNYSVSADIMRHCIREAGIRNVLTTGKVLEKFDYQFDCGVPLLDDLRAKVTLWDKLSCALLAYLAPVWWIAWSLGGICRDRNEVLTVIFTSGSTGMPKGVMLTHGNVGSNVEAIEQVVSLRKTDTIVGVLPFFHSFGYTVTLWTAMSLDIAGAYHFSPLDARQIGKLVESMKGTVFLATPTFLRSYLKRCTPEEFASLEIVVVGAEKLPHELCDEFEQKFGIRPIEGYGATELSPLVSVNIPPARRLDNFQVDCKEGTVGRPVPNVTARVTDLETGAVLGADQPGMLWITGPNVMKGYLNHPEQTAQVVVDGWYRTGDVAVIDTDGFIRITGRMSRFSKIGGEMVPHVTIEETMLAALGGVDDVPVLAVTAVPDDRKGERLVVLHTPALGKTPDQLCQALTAAGLPNLYLPSRDSFWLVDEIPVLGTGKIDLKGIRDRALQMAAAEKSGGR